VIRLTRFLTALALAIVPPLLAQDAPKPKPVTVVPKTGNQINIPYEKYTLPNGLTVILSQDRSTPMVAVNLSYHVGSKNEVPGRTGFAHLFEHVMFTGSGHVPYGMHDRLTEGVGGGNNGGTGNDETIYYDEVPANYLESVLWLESDRMGWLLDKLDTAKYNAQRSIVQQERKQRYDNVPFGRADEIIASYMYPPTNPYSWMPIGHLADLQAAPIEAVKEFFRQYYAPNNATVAIVGDFEPAAARRLIAKYFGELPRGKAIVRPRVAPAVLAGETRLTFVDSAVTSSPRLFISWPGTTLKSPDQYALSVLGSILGGSRTARLAKALVYDRQLATSVSVGADSLEDTGLFEITINPRPGVSLTQLETITDSIIDRLKRDGPTPAELTRARAGAELRFITNLETNLDKAISLASNQSLHADPGHGFRVDYQQLRAVTVADVKRVANTYLTGNRIVLSVVPPGQTDKASKAGRSLVVMGAKQGGNR
jgi:zinc protease